MKHADVHAHLSHRDFASDLDDVIQRASDASLGAVVCNGLEPVSNRFVLDLAARSALVLPALGIYPTDAVQKLLPADFPFHSPAFDVDAEIAFIAGLAAQARSPLAAIGEIGLDGHWLDESTLPEQERVFAALATIARDADLPVIVHSRKHEVRCLEILAGLGCRRVVMHCFGGKPTLAKAWAEREGWCFSIPANARVSHGFTKMLKILPPESILTETDCPYMGPVRGERNEPAKVVGTVAYLAELREWTLEAAADQVWSNFCRVFKPEK